jgi:zinc protease
VVGDFDPESVEALLSELLGDWESPVDYEEIASPYPEPEIAPASETFSTPDKENAVFMAGMPVKMSAEHEDYPALLLGNYILGQGPASRLFGRIRGQEGLSYGVSSQFQAPAEEDGARFVVNAISAPENTARVEASFRDELASILEDGYSEEEIAAAKRSWVQSRQVGRSNDQQLASILLGNLHLDRTMQWDADLEARVLALTAEDVREAMRRHLDPDAMAYMRGGDFADVAD